MQKNREAKLPVDQQAAKHVARVKYAPLTLISIKARALQLKLKDPLLFNAFQSLEKGEDSTAFLQLYQYAKDGKLKGNDTFTEICEVLTNRIRRQTSDNDNLKYGVRYPANYLNFIILLRSYGSNSACQFGILTSQLGGPSSRHLRFVHLYKLFGSSHLADSVWRRRALVSKSEDSLHQPQLHFENMARLKRLMDCVKFTGPCAFGGDCTKVRKRLSYSSDFGGHVLGSVQPLDECEVHDVEDIDSIVDHLGDRKATQIRAIMVKVMFSQLLY
jgi:hypothetical protein